MTQHLRTLQALGPALALLWALAAPAQVPVAAPQAASAAAAAPIGALKSLGNNRYQIHRIVVDKAARTITVPGRVHVLGQPLEYLATSRDGMKQYESMLELDASGSELNLACILIGLERDPAQPPLHQFDRHKVVGPHLAISIAWTDGGRRREVPAAQALLNPDSGVQPESVVWVYTGSFLSPGDGSFAADRTGTLIGVVHDGNTVIETEQGVGIGAYGSVRGNAMLPPVGSPVELIIDAANVGR
ncbi:MAG: hypothetical protein KGN16_00500 [Burkholderiales bacterium]|nr:hypothetical protein [Burkholderiales bacterium]